MKKIFLDANIVIDFLDASSKDHSTAVDCLSIIRKHFGKPVVSPITFIITNFILGKFAKNKDWHKKQMQYTFSEFEITPIQPSFIPALFSTHFTDLEDGLQHQCALHAKARVILTKDIKDYFDSKIPVVHPADFVNKYNNLLPR
ncbi:type II toxin-antitoxin system VapC family toxin [Puia dinghuensis]|uniref:Twitching motility protein PilT n=1 Tax=Puia dinghuensis TaxID=1792502 RepID=A0A8J2UAZ8_9BACT|nr:PIN domain-containing protein [Puia dinghuensis]GGA91704.1 twitching motility protein PilT [Puia dinghuensis]